MSRQFHHRRRHDPTVTIHHGSNADCPDVQAGRVERCRGHTSIAALVPLVPDEGPIEHLRNALAVLRFALDFGEPIFGSGDGPGVVVHVRDLARLQARVEAAIGLLELDGRSVCLTCGGTILQPTIGGVPRGSCHCPRERITDWSGEGAVEIRREP